ncbi:hypothetical protein M3697_12500 [Janibacter melonis]|uniref:hypothetical protein n=1 Tax=Janibacter melonis TaxID=262209 RepID=UPI0020440615|nr:hypothetical protein [Janibacter melonis]MCM3555917.1 hypothetical protein [Janibacter melonis]
MRHLTATAAVIVATTAALGGCSSEETPPPTSSSTISAPPTADYLETSEQTVTKGAEVDPNDTKALEAAYSKSLLKQTKQVDAAWKREGLTLKGRNEVLWTKPGKYTKPDVGDEQTTVDACVVRNAQVFDKDGNDITADQKGKPLKKGAKTLIRYVLTTPDDGTTWLIDSWTEKGSCTAQQQS